MLKASALYIVIVIALVIGVLCSSLIVTAYFYRLQYQKTFRYDHLQNDVNSGINILLSSQNNTKDEEKLDLFGNGEDSVLLTKIQWGIYDVGISKAFSQTDTLYKIFSIANGIDSAKWGALYLIDEDRPLSVSGNTAIKGDVYIPKAGVKEAYVDGKSYFGDKRLIIGKKHNSDKKLPDLIVSRLAQFEQWAIKKPKADTNLLTYDSVKNSFLQPAHFFNFGKKIASLKDIKISGNIVLFSDTTLTITGSTQLSDIIVFARTIVVKAGFNGTCQLFATDSIKVENNCIFNYPSCLGELRFKSPIVNAPEKIGIGENSHISGLVFTYDKTNNNNLKPIIDLGKNTIITGQIYSQGIVGLKDGVVVNGSLFTSRFLYQSTYTRYENYIINTNIDASALSPYYLTSDLLPVAAKKKKVLQWLEEN